MNTNTLFNIKETALNTLNEGVTLSANTVIGAKHLSCSCEGYHVYKVMLNDECNAQFNKVSVVRQGENNFLRNANLTDMLIKTSDGQAKSYKNFTTDYIIVKMEMFYNVKKKNINYMHGSRFIYYHVFFMW